MLYSPMEKFINNPIISINFSFTNINLYLIIGLFLILFLNLINRNTIINNNLEILQESLYRTILLLIENFIGLKYQQYLPFFYSIFFFIFFSNFIGLIPYSSTPTVEIIMTLSLAFTLLIGNIIIGFLNHNIYLLSVFLPAGCPTLLIPLMVLLELIAYIFRTISLGLRLAINLITGKILSNVIVGFIYVGYISGISIIILILPLSILTVFLCLEILIAYLQAYIFIFITCLTFKDLA